jgi:hypothetical protein
LGSSSGNEPTAKNAYARGCDGGNGYGKESGCGERMVEVRLLAVRQAHDKLAPLGRPPIHIEKEWYY